MTNHKYGQEDMTTLETYHVPGVACPGQDILKLLTGKWKPQILRLASENEYIRFNSLLRLLPGSNKQSVSVALRELERDQLLSKTIVAQKPLHIEYYITEKGKSMIPIFVLASSIATKQESD
jgi:DNA-binding HxlR family transcriptional regulator